MRALTPLFAIAALSVAAVSLSAQRLAATLSGNWAYEVVTENGTGTPAVVMTQTGDSLTGSYTSGRMGTLPFKGSVKGQTFTFAVNTSGGATLTFHGTIVDADHVKGDVDFGGQGGATFSGTRKP
ncbi:MAG: hypothetical protein P3B76_09665 [Gemmatimonadota bacterium]|jgi:hypothetical protein|nr:hypothetical protein [Gemmatimonadota bacterium]MDQ8167849.1 hypothetical protein [Gemmatimonadota bacterium]MDQ8172936.1 hypothetical protein [Gemmatimonadota bacterium]